MQELKPHPKLETQNVQLGSVGPAVRLSGYIASSPEGVVRLHVPPSGNEYVDIPKKAISYSEQDAKTLLAKLSRWSHGWTMGPKPNGGWIIAL